MKNTWKNEKEARSCIKNMVKKYYEEFKENNEEFKEGNRINYGGRIFAAEEMCYLTDSLLDFWLTTGRFSVEFEKNFANWLGISYAHLVNSGSSANLLAFMVLTAPELGDRRIKRGDEVITVACGFPTTIAPIIQYGAIPVFVDVTIPEYNIDVKMLENALSKKTKALMLAHTLGNAFNVEVVKAFCDEHDLWLIEDNCDSLGGTYILNGKKKYLGTWGDIGTSSFYPPHHMTMGEGGCIYTDNPLLSNLILSYRDWGRACVCPSGHDNICGNRFGGKYGHLPEGYDHKYVYNHFGYNLKVTEMQAAIGCAQLKRLPKFIQLRQNNWEYLRNSLADISNYVILPEPEKNSSPSWFGFMLTLKETAPIKRKELIQHLENHNIQTRLLFGGNLIKHPCFDTLKEDTDYRVVGELRNTDYIMNNTFWIGVYPGMKKEMLDYMVSEIKNALFV